MYKQITEELLAFLKNSPSCFHAQASAAEILRAHGFTELTEEAKWKLEKGGSYRLYHSGRRKRRLPYFCQPQRFSYF